MRLNQHLLDLLERIGLSSSEARFYLAAFQCPKHTLKDLQQKSGLSRAATYRAFERLHDLGFITSSPDSWRKNIETVSLHTVAEKLAREQRKLRKVELELKRLNTLMGIPGLDLEKDPVQILTDPNQIVEKAYQIVSLPWQHFSCYGSAERLIDIIGDKAERDFVRLRSLKGKSCNALLTEIGPYTREILPNNQEQLRNVKARIDIQNQKYITYIYGSEMTMWQKDPELGNRAVVITDPGVVGTYANMMQTLWQAN